MEKYSNTGAIHLCIDDTGQPIWSFYPNGININGRLAIEEKVICGYKFTMFSDGGTGIICVGNEKGENNV